MFGFLPTFKVTNLTFLVKNRPKIGVWRLGLNFGMVKL